MKLELNNVSKEYGSKTVLDNVNLSIEDRNIIGIIGPSGGGKSSLLRMIAGFEEITTGEIIINNINVSKEVNKLHKNCGFVFQSHNLFLHLTVLDNITLILEKVHKYKPQKAKKRALTLLEKFSLTDHIKKKPQQLSGGEAQRVSIVRALAIDPAVLFFDEPTSSLDPVLTYDVLDTIVELEKVKKDFIIVTHEIGFVNQVADYIIFIDEGKIIEHGDVSIIKNPREQKFKDFLSKVLSWNLDFV
ncbi:MAG: amino acid ABC transporter ATP-binding protein [bacterium]